MTIKWYTVLDQTFQIERQKEDENGFLHVWGQAAVEGTMSYPEYGFKAFVPAETLRASVDGLVGKPVLRDHPPKGQLVSPKDAKNKVLGTVMEAAFDESESRVLVHVVVYDGTLKAEIQTKVRSQLSPGYLTAFKDLETPTTDGATKYQAKRIYNHLAFVEAARGGENCTAFDAAPPPLHKEIKMEDENKDKSTSPGEKPSFDADKYKAELDAMFKKGMDELKAFMKGKKGDEDKDEDEEEDKGEVGMDAKTMFGRMKLAQSIVSKHGLDVPDADDLQAYEAAVAKAYSGKDVDASLIPGVLFAADAAPARTDAEKTRKQFRSDGPGSKPDTKATDAKLDPLPPARDWHLAALTSKSK
jgi:hypothetical protein